MAKSTQPSQSTAAQPPPGTAVAPTNVGSGDYTAYIWQQINDMRGALGEVKNAIDHQTAAIERLDNKADETKDKIHAINLKLGIAAAVAAVVIAIVGFVLKEVWDVVKPAIVQRLTTDPNQGQSANTQPSRPTAAPTAQIPTATPPAASKQ